MATKLTQWPFSAQVSAYQEELRIITTGTCEPETLEDCKNGRWDAYGFRNAAERDV